MSIELYQNYWEKKEKHDMGKKCLKKFITYLTKQTLWLTVFNFNQIATLYIKELLLFEYIDK